MSTRIPVGDVQKAAREIVSCFANVLTVRCLPLFLVRLTVILQAVNAPLQQRTSVLDLDASRANTLPNDYDTDLESPWSNPSKILLDAYESNH